MVKIRKHNSGGQCEWSEKRKYRKTFVMDSQEIEYFKKEGEVNYMKCSELSELRIEKCSLNSTTYMSLMTLTRLDLPK